MPHNMWWMITWQLKSFDLNFNHKWHVFILPSLLFTEQQQRSDIQHSYFKCLVSKSALKFSWSLWAYVWEDVMTDSDWRLPLSGPFVCSLREVYGILCIVCMFLIPCPGPWADPTLNLFCRRPAEDGVGGGGVGGCRLDLNCGASLCLL